MKAKNGPRRVLIERAKLAPARFCKKPDCSQRITGKRVYCSNECRLEHEALLKIERRPKDLYCDACGSFINPLMRSPKECANRFHFCDSVCVDLYRRQHNHYQTISAIGNAKQRQARSPNDKRRVVTSQNNKLAPPRLKLLRTGNVWGYSASIQPNSQRSGYIAFLPDCEEAGIVECKTARECLTALRKRFIESRQKTGE